MFRIFYELHNDDQLDFGTPVLPRIDAQIITMPDGEAYNPYDEYEVCNSEQEEL